MYFVVLKQNDKIMRILLSFLIGLFLSLPIFAQFSLKQILSEPFPSGLSTAPTKEKVVWILNEEGVRNIWMASGPNFNINKVTNFSKDDGQAIGNLIIKEDTEDIIFVRGGAPNRRGEIPNPTSQPDGEKRYIFEISEKGGAIDTLSEGSNATLAPNNKALAFIKNGQVWVYDFATKKAKQALKIRGRAGQIAWSPNSEKLGFRSNRGDHSFIGVYDVGKHELNYLSPSVDNDSNPVWAPDGTALAFIRIPTEKGLLPFYPRRSALPWSIMVHNFTKNKTLEVWKAAKGQGSAFRSISAANQLFWTADNHLVFPYEGAGWTHLWTMPLDGGQAKKPNAWEF